MFVPPRARLTLGAALVGVSLLGGRALALTVGEPRVVTQGASHWVVEVPLGDWGRVRPDQVLVRLAPPPSWQAAGLTWVDPQTIRIEPPTERGVVRIELTASAGFKDLLIEVQWPRGRLQRELGLLLDPSTSVWVPRVGLPGQVWVQAGDTASHVVAAYLGDSGGVAQALMALQQTNPEAFIGDNVNRLRAGAVLKLPSREAVQAIDPQQASEALARQIEEFAMVRAEMAAQAEGAGNTDAPQVATGKVQPAHRDKAETPADRLTLSVPGADASSDRIAQQRQAQHAAERAAELNRNIQELNRLTQSEGGGLPAPVPPAASPSSEVIDRWAAHPLTPWASLGLVALLLCWIIWRATRRTAVSTHTSVAQAPAPPLRVDFDLELPRVDELPPLPADLLRDPTPAIRSAPSSSSHGGSGIGANPMAGLSLDLDDPGRDTSAPTASPTDPWVLRLSLAQALWVRGLTQTAWVLAREVAAHAPPDVAQNARAWLDEHA